MSGGGGVGYILGLGAIIIYAAFLSAIIFIRFLIYKIRKKKSEIRGLEFKAINTFDGFLSAVTGFVFSILIFKSLSFSFGGWPFGFLIHGILLLIFMGLGFAILKLILECREGMQFKALIFLLALLCGMSTFSALGIFYPSVVIQSAQSIAGENAYCIGLNQRNRPLISVEDLTFLTMDKGRIGHHAFLLVEADNGVMEPYHWSYLQSKFLPGVVNWANKNRPSIPCRPKHDFSSKLPLTGYATNGDLEFYFDGSFLKIKKAYAPQISSNYISIAARAPDFSPALRERGVLYASKEVRSVEWMKRLQNRHENVFPSGKVGDLYAIKSESDQEDWYYRYDESGELLTVVGCYASRPPNTACQHRFYKDGAMYTFDHSADLLSQSDEMEGRLFALFESFKEKR